MLTFNYKRIFLKMKDMTPIEYRSHILAV
ncbi:MULTISPECIES: IS3 family transposase [Lactobacillaceae]|nr:IS3 family transposase [Limosilactobacillus reuteri]MQB77516.1 hypothetical protein [Limosilactobacillus reuteri]MQB99546.1 hypothetical protein [Limosilactobacillus reuteri]